MYSESQRVVKKAAWAVPHVPDRLLPEFVLQQRGDAKEGQGEIGVRGAVAPARGKSLSQQIWKEREAFSTTKKHHHRGSLSFGSSQSRG